jgi:UDP-N-acetylmuramoyl-L-alanyl-D-glutamate--2,6-diaminopimelate ligase
MRAAILQPPGMLLSDLLRGFADAAPLGELRVSGLSLDSREVQKGYVFCALHGGRQHGLAFANAAARQGAAVILAESSPLWPAARCERLGVELGLPVIRMAHLSRDVSAIAARYYGDPSGSLDVTAVTGTNGKTSVTHYLAQALRREQVCGLIGTLGYGLPEALNSTRHTTPDAVCLQAILADLKQQGAAAVAMEMSSHALAQARAAAVRVDTAVFTNLTRDHLDYHGDMAAYLSAKRRLFEWPGLGNAVLNADDPYMPQLLERLDATVTPVLYSLDPAWRPPSGVSSWIRADALNVLARGMRVRFSSSWGAGQFDSGLLGRFNAGNLLAVLAVLLLKGWNLQRALDALSQIQGVAGRMECFGAAGQPLVVVDYAHTPDALEQALRVLREHQPRRLLSVFGCGGERDVGKRAQMGELAARLSDQVIVTDDNPRGEDGELIVADILSGIGAATHVSVQRQRGRAIRYAVCLAGARDIVLIAGKGHETVQYVGHLALPFSDRAQVTQALNEWGGCHK